MTHTTRPHGGHFPGTRTCFPHHGHCFHPGSHSRPLRRHGGTRGPPGTSGRSAARIPHPVPETSLEPATGLLLVLPMTAQTNKTVRHPGRASERRDTLGLLFQCHQGHEVPEEGRSQQEICTAVSDGGFGHLLGDARGESHEAYLSPRRPGAAGRCRRRPGPCGPCTAAPPCSGGSRRTPAAGAGRAREGLGSQRAKDRAAPELRLVQ